MRWLYYLPFFFFGLSVVVVILSLKVETARTLRKTLPHLLALFLISLLILLMKTPWLRNIPFSQKILFVLWLLFLIFLLALGIRLAAFVFFDFLFMRKLGMKYPRLIKDVVVFILYIIGFLLILNYYLNIKITVLLASSAILTVVIGFALQDIFGNLFSGIVLNFEDSLRIGDWIEIGSRVGRLEQFGWRSFKIKTLDKELVVIPNLVASKEQVVVLEASERPFAIKLRIGAAYGHSPDTVIAALRSVCDSLPWVRKEPAPSFHVVDFADFAITYELKCFAADYSLRNFMASELRRRIWYTFRRCGIQIPFPSRDIYLRHEGRPGPSEDLLLRALGENPVLQAIDETQLRNLTQGMEVKVYGRDETVIREGEAGGYLHHLLTGAMRVLKDGRQVAHLGAGDFFGEISLLTGEPTTATVVAATESQVILVSSRRFKETVSMNEELARRLSEVIVRRRGELREFSERQALEDSRVLKKDSETLFRRIMKYFAKP